MRVIDRHEISTQRCTTATSLWTIAKINPLSQHGYFNINTQATRSNVASVPVSKEGQLQNRYNRSLDIVNQLGRRERMDIMTTMATSSSRRNRTSRVVHIASSISCCSNRNYKRELPMPGRHAFTNHHKACDFFPAVDNNDASL